MRISEAAARLDMTPRMLRYREQLGLLPAEADGRPTGEHRRYEEEDLAAVSLSLALERRYGVSPVALAFAVRVLAEPDVARRVRELATRLGRLSPLSTRALDFEKQRALRWLSDARNSDTPAEPG